MDRFINHYVRSIYTSRCSGTTCWLSHRLESNRCLAVEPCPGLPNPALLVNCKRHSTSIASLLDSRVLQRSSLNHHIIHWYSRDSRFRGSDRKKKDPKKNHKSMEPKDDKTNDGMRERREKRKVCFFPFSLCRFIPSRSATYGKSTSKGGKARGSWNTLVSWLRSGGVVYHHWHAN